MVNGEPALIEQQVLERQTNRDLQGTAGLSLQHGAAGRVLRRASQHHVRSGAQDRMHSPCSTGSRCWTARRRTARPPTRSTSGHHLGGAGVRQLDLRRDGPDPGPALSAGGYAHVRLDLDYVGVLADCRRYFMLDASLHPRGAADALRPLRGGRRGSATSSRSSWATRGWCAATATARSTASECHPPPGSTRTAVRSSTSCWAAGWSWRNLELRFPLFGVLGVGSGYYGVLPLDFTVFGDGGHGLGQRRTAPVSRVAVTGPRSSAPAPDFRFNLFGFAVAEVEPGPSVRAAGQELAVGVELQQGF